jgi:hypothetical protein
MRLTKMVVSLVVLLAAGAFVAGCSSDPQPQTFTGSFGAEWNGLVQELRATSPSGATVAQVGQNAGFELVLAGGQTYTFEVARADGTTVPLIFPRQGGIATQLSIASGAAPFVFGQIRLVTPFKSSEFMVGLSGDDRDDVECEDGIDAITGLPCADEDDESETCDDGEDADTDGDNVECEDGVDAATGLPCDDDQDDTGDGDGECVDGVDSVTGDPCTDDDMEYDEAAVPDSVPPDGLGTCVDENDNDDDNDGDGNEDDD